MSEEILLTMGMPVYNEEEHIAEAIESLLAQTYKNFILIISDNASTDRTEQICKYYAEKDKRIIYVRHKENMGAMFSGRYLIEQTKTPFFMRCSGNDKWHPCFVEKLLPVLKENNDTILSYPKAAFINLDGTLSEAHENDYTTTGINKPADRYLYFLWRFRPKISNMHYGIWRTQALKNCRLDIYALGADIILLYEAAFEGRFKMHREVLFYMRKSEVGVGRKSRKKMIIKQLYDLTGEKPTGKENLFLFSMLFVWISIRVPFRKQYPLKTIARIWLSANALIANMLMFIIEPIFNDIFKKFLPEKYYLKLKLIWRKIE